MANYYFISIDPLVTTFSLIESGKDINFTIQTPDLDAQNIGIKAGDKLLATLNNSTTFNMDVIEVLGDSIVLKKIFEIAKDTDFRIDSKEQFIALSKKKYDEICFKLISDFTTKIEIKEKPEGYDHLKGMFADWFIEKDGVDHNYFKNNFGSSREKLMDSLSKYEEIYESEFHKTIFNFSGNNLDEFINELEVNLYLETGSFFNFSEKISTHMPRAILGKNNYIKFLKEIHSKSVGEQISFSPKLFYKKTKVAGLKFTEKLIIRFVASLCTKPFVILTGLSGSGKTKLAQAFVQWISESEEQYRIIPVGADWTNREPLLGYPDGLRPGEYVMPDSGALQVMINALKPGNENKPYFLILDEMNLSHVERYFADFLSVMESRKTIMLYDGKDRKHGEEPVEGPDDRETVKKEISWPKNLFIIGTVNVDETTYMFSPKVLDRANVIEFRVEPDEMKEFLNNPGQLQMEKLYEGENEKNPGLGASMAADFIKLATDKAASKDAVDALISFFPELQKAGAEFGYRSASEINILVGILENLLKADRFWDESEKEPIVPDDFIDIAIMQKLLPKLHGSRNKLVPVLASLGRLCLIEDYKKTFPDNEAGERDFISKCLDSPPDSGNVKYRISFGKIRRMYLTVIASGFTSYAEN